jgi:putative GTP pyrophosphokinase
MGTFLGLALKSGQGERPWREFFEVSSAALAHVEGTAPVPGYENLSRKEVFTRVAKAENDLHVLRKLQGFSIAADKITTERGTGSYHLIVLDSTARTVSIKPFPVSQLQQANVEYAKIEERTQRGEQIEAVLVSAGPVDALKKAYPNFFLDTHAFVTQIGRVITRASTRDPQAKRSGRRA